jgi:hypothetical protein
VVAETAGKEALQISPKRPRMASASVSSLKPSAPRYDAATGRHVVRGIEHQEGVLQLADLFMRAVHLDGVPIAREQRHHARAVPLQEPAVVQHEVDPPGAARPQEGLQRVDARRIVQAQRGPIGVERAQLAPGLQE